MYDLPSIGSIIPPLGRYTTIKWCGVSDSALTELETRNSKVAVSGGDVKGS
jgi:hypothetical protein